MLILILTALLFETSTSQITGYGDKTADYGGDAHYSCSVANPTGVLQVTWQRLFKEEVIEHLATYSKRFGQQVNDPHRGKVIFTEASLGSTSITLRNVTWGDESCYICSFNAYPDGSKRKQTCLTVQGISKVRTEVQPPNSEDEDVAVVFSCSATGKPAPTIHWDFSPGATSSDQPPTSTENNGDHTFTSSRNVTLQVPAGWTGHVDCLLNRGAVGQRRERIPFSLPARKKEVEGQTALIESQHTVLAALGDDACLNCQLMQPKDVVQVTWLKRLPEGEKNLASNHKRYGHKVNPDYKNKVELKASGLQSSSIVIRNVTDEDEGCYRCLFNIYPDGALAGTTCLQLYELHEAVLHVGESNSAGEVLVSCSATGRPAPTVTLTLPRCNSISVTNTSITNTNGTVTVTTTAVLSRLSDNGQVGCAARVLSGPQSEVYAVIPEVTQSSADGFDVDSGSDHSWIIVLVAVLCVCAAAAAAAVITILYKRKHQNRQNPQVDTFSTLAFLECVSVSQRDEENKKDSHEPRTPLMNKEDELRQRMSAAKAKKSDRPKTSLPGRKPFTE